MILTCPGMGDGGVRVGSWGRGREGSRTWGRGREAWGCDNDMRSL